MFNKALKNFFKLGGFMTAYVLIPILAIGTMYSLLPCSFSRSTSCLYGLRIAPGDQFGAILGFHSTVFIVYGIVILVGVLIGAYLQTNMTSMGYSRASSIWALVFMFGAVAYGVVSSVNLYLTRTVSELGSNSSIAELLSQNELGFYIVISRLIWLLGPLVIFILVFAYSNMDRLKGMLPKPDPRKKKDA